MSGQRRMQTIYLARDGSLQFRRDTGLTWQEKAIFSAVFMLVAGALAGVMLAIARAVVL